MEATVPGMVWLVAVQFGLYAAGWLLCARLMARERAAALHWAAFMLLLGLGFWLASQRDEFRSFWAYSGAGFAFLASYLALHRGLECFVHRPPDDRGHLLLLGLAGITLALLGPGAEQAPARVLVSYGGGALLMLRIVLALRLPLQAEYGRRVAHLIAAPGYLLIAASSLRALRQALDWEHAYELHRADHLSQGLLFGYLVGAALFNFSFIALVTLRVLQRLHHLSRHDELTGLANRRVLDEAIEREWQRLQRTGAGFAVVMLDLDHFKQINDTHGHAAGDSVLAVTAERLREAARRTDLVARLGGEEFLVLMPATELPAALAAAERLLERLRARPCEAGGLSLGVTASAGVAVARADDPEAQAALRRADLALYRAKSQGRDRVEAG